MLEKDFTKPVYQKIGRIRAVNFHANLFTRLNRGRFRNQVRQRHRRVLKHLGKRGAEGFKSNVGCVLQNAKAGHDTIGESSRRQDSRRGHTARTRRHCLPPVINHNGEAERQGQKLCLLFSTAARGMHSSPKLLFFENSSTWSTKASEFR